MIELHIQGTRYTVSVEKYCWQLDQWGVNKKTGEPTSSPVGYYTKLSALADKLAKLGCADGVANELHALQSIEAALRAILGDKAPLPAYEDMG